MAGKSALSLSVASNLKASNSPVGKASDKAANNLLPKSAKVEAKKQRQRVTVHSKSYKTGSLRVIQYNLLTGVEWRVSFKQRQPEKKRQKGGSKTENKFLTANKADTDVVSQYGTFKNLPDAVRRYHEIQNKILYTPGFLTKNGARRKPLVVSKNTLAAVTNGLKCTPVNVNLTHTQTTYQEIPVATFKPAVKKIKYSTR